LAQGFDVLPLAQAHGPAGFFQTQLKPIGLRKSIDKNLSGGKRAKVHHGARPVKDDGFQLVFWCRNGGHKRPRKKARNAISEHARLVWIF
jgi:hypothetical protein